MNKLEAVARAICKAKFCQRAAIGHKAGPCINPETRTIITCQASRNELALGTNLGAAKAAIHCLLDFGEDEINACIKEPTANNVAYYRAMLQSVLDEGRE